MAKAKAAILAETRVMSVYETDMNRLLPIVFMNGKREKTSP